MFEAISLSLNLTFGILCFIACIATIVFIIWFVFYLIGFIYSIPYFMFAPEPRYEDTVEKYSMWKQVKASTKVYLCWLRGKKAS